MEINPIERWRAHVTSLPTLKKSKGVGDTIAKLTSTIGMKPCGGCKKRQKALNKAFPYKS